MYVIGKFLLSNVNLFNTFSHLLVSPAGLESSKYIDILKKFGGAYNIPATLMASFFRELNMGLSKKVISATGI